MLSLRSLPRHASRGAVTIFATSILGLAGAAGAYAETPSLAGYAGPGGQTEGTITPGGQLPATTVAPTTTVTPPAQGVAPAEVGGNEVLGANAGGGKAPESATAPVAATAPAAAEAKNRLVGNLPFTGLDLALLAGAGLGLAGLGLGLRRMTGSQPQAG